MPAYQVPRLNNAETRFVVEGGPFGAMTNPVTSVCAMETATAFEIAAYTVPGGEV